MRTKLQNINVRMKDLWKSLAREFEEVRVKTSVSKYDSSIVVPTLSP